MLRVVDSSSSNKEGPQHVRSPIVVPPLAEDQAICLVSPKVLLTAEILPVALAEMLTVAGVPPLMTAKVTPKSLVLTVSDKGKSYHSASQVMSATSVVPVSLTSPSTRMMLSDDWEQKRVGLFSQF